MCSNVLCVIQEDDVIIDILSHMKQYKSDTTTIYIQVYSGDKSGTGKETTKGWQSNQSTVDYIQFIKKIYRHNNIEIFKDIIIIK